MSLACRTSAVLFSVVVAEFCRFQPGLTWIHRSWMNQDEQLISVASAVDTTMDFGHHSSLKSIQNWNCVPESSMQCRSRDRVWFGLQGLPQCRCLQWSLRLSHPEQSEVEGFAICFLGGCKDGRTSRESFCTVCPICLSFFPAMTAMNQKIRRPKKDIFPLFSGTDS